jgi:hypothetical protein
MQSAVSVANKASTAGIYPNLNNALILNLEGKKGYPSVF